MCYIWECSDCYRHRGDDERARRSSAVDGGDRGRGRCDRGAPEGSGLHAADLECRRRRGLRPLHLAARSRRQGDAGQRRLRDLGRTRHRCGCSDRLPVPRRVDELAQGDLARHDRARRGRAQPGEQPRITLCGKAQERGQSPLVGHVDVAGVRYELPDGRVLLDDVSFRVGDGAKVALVGANGAGKTTLLRIITGEIAPHAGAVTRSGGLGVMRQAVGQGLGPDPDVADLLMSVSPARVRSAAAEVDRLERRLMEADDEATQMRYATALAEFGDAGGYDIEVVWDTCCTTALGVGFDKAKYRSLRTLSGGEQKRLVLEYLVAGPDEVLLLDEPDNYLDVPGKIWLEQRIRESGKTILFISHDRELLANTATRIITVELGAAGNNTWTHPGGFASYHDARRERFARFEELQRRWDEEHAKLKALVLRYKIKAEYNDGMASQYKAAQTRLRKFEEAGPPQAIPREQQVTMRLKGGRTGKRAVVCEGLELTGLMAPFDLEVWYGERVAVLGSNGSGKSRFL